MDIYGYWVPYEPRFELMHIKTGNKKELSNSELYSILDAVVSKIAKVEEIIKNGGYIDPDLNQKNDELNLILQKISDLLQDDNQSMIAEYST